jgi:hypothetical protein
VAKEDPIKALEASRQVSYNFISSPSSNLSILNSPNLSYIRHLNMSLHLTFGGLSEFL